jgi:hypothetical protein
MKLVTYQSQPTKGKYHISILDSAISCGIMVQMQKVKRL